MRYTIEIRIATKNRRSYKIDAKDEKEALSKLALRLPPDQRDNYVVDSISIDPLSINSDEPFGIFGGE